MKFTDVPCVFCGGLCDDLAVEIEDVLIKKVTRGCALSQGKFLSHTQNVSHPAIRKNGELVRVALDDAIDEAAAILKRARYPLIFGLSNTETGALRKCVELAEMQKVQARNAMLLNEYLASQEE